MTSPDRRPLVAGNWKMNTTVLEALNLTTLIRQHLDPDPFPEVVLLPPFISVWPVQQLLADDPRIAVGAQDCYWEKSGAYTGAVSAAMLVGSCQYVLVGHSERRRVFGDDDGAVRRKLDAVLEADLRPILAVGESWEERQSGRTDEILEVQTRAGLSDVPHHQLLRCVARGADEFLQLGSAQLSIGFQFGFEHCQRHPQDPGGRRRTGNRRRSEGAGTLRRQRYGQLCRRALRPSRCGRGTHRWGQSQCRGVLRHSCGRRSIRRLNRAQEGRAPGVRLRQPLRS